MARVLDCAWEPLVSTVAKRANGKVKAAPKQKRKKMGRPKGSKNRPRQPGPASRALALHQAAQPLQAAPAPLQAPSRPVPVLVFELHSDGTSHVALKTTLPADRGSALLRQLLDFGLTASV